LQKLSTGRYLWSSHNAERRRRDLRRVIGARRRTKKGFDPKPYADWAARVDEHGPSSLMTPQGASFEPFQVTLKSYRFRALRTICT
jgi:hypothetical protein